MAVSLLHLVDESNSPVAADIRTAVEAAYRWSVREYREIDAADLAAMAEKVARAMSKKDAGYIQSPRRYAFAALAGKIQEWFRAHPAKMIHYKNEDELDRLIGPDHGPSLEMERRALFAQVRVRLNERDRQICMLMEQGLNGPTEVARALNISYRAAAKALQRVRDRIAGIVINQPGDNEEANSKAKVLDFRTW